MNTTDDRISTHLHDAAKYGHLEVVQLLLTVPNIAVSATDSNGATSFHEAACRGHHKIVKLLLAVSNIGESAADSASDRITPHLSAASSGYSEIV